MNENFERELFEIDPEMFGMDSTLKADPQKNAMAFGFDHEDGWYPLVKELVLTAKWKKDNPKSIREEGDPEKDNLGFRKSLPCVAENKAAWLEDVQRVQKEHTPIRVFRIVTGLEKTKNDDPADNDIPFFVYYEHKCERPWNHFRIVQVKEKYGGLRFYTSGGDDEFEGAIGLAEQLSYHICEVCGAWGAKQCGGGWIKTLCDGHAIPYLGGTSTGQISNEYREEMMEGE